MFITKKSTAGDCTRAAARNLASEYDIDGCKLQLVICGARFYLSFSKTNVRSLPFSANALHYGGFWVKLGRKKYWKIDGFRSRGRDCAPIVSHKDVFVPIICVQFLFDFALWKLRRSRGARVRCWAIVGKTTDSKRDFSFKQKIETPQLTPLTLSV